MKEKSIRALLIEDNPGDARLIREMLADARIAFELDWKPDLGQGLERLDAGSVDVVLLDLTLPDSRGLDTFTRTFAHAPAVPIIVLSGLDDETLAIQAVHSGAQDYLVKDQVDAPLLGRAIRYAIERKRVEERFRGLLESAPDGIVLADRRGTILLVNGQTEKLFGHSRQELVGQPVETLLPLSARARHVAHRETYASAPRLRPMGQQLDLFGRRKDGTEFPVEITLSPLFGEGDLRVLAIIRDITERKAAVERTARSEKILADAQQIAHIGSWEWEVVSDRVTWSDELYRIYGLQPSELEATFESYLGRVHPDDRSRVRATIEAAMRDHRPFTFEERIVCPDGSVRTLFSRGETVADRAGRVVRMIGACQDITERKRGEIELAHARDAALQSARLKSAFIANMSHEIRTPLNIILGYNAFMAEDPSTLDERSRRSFVEGVRRAGSRLMATIDGIVDISKIETGNFEVRPVRLELSSLIERQVEDFRVLAQEKGLALSCSIETANVAVRFDEYCLSHALMNLLQNAIKFTQQGGVWVLLDRDAEGALRISIRDTGVGIDPAYLPRLFEPFSQEEVDYTRRFEGSGLGLALTKEYLDLNGARLSVESRKGKGSVFRIHFSKACEAVGPSPAPRRNVAPGGTPAPGPSAGTGKPPILVVEDDPDNQAYMRVTLEKRYDVLLAASGEEVRERLRTHPGRILMILMDLSLRGPEDGLMLTRYLREQELWRDVPIIAITAHAFPEDRLKAMAAGCNAYLAKPFRRAELFSMVDDLLSLARSTPPNASELQ